jgi:hypothetical protein
MIPTTITETETKVISHRTQVLLQEIPEVIHQLGVLAAEIRSRAQQLWTESTIQSQKWASDLVRLDTKVLESIGQTTICSLQKTGAEHFPERCYAIVGSAVFRDRLNYLIEVVHNHPCTTDIDTSILRNAGKRITEATSNIPPTPPEQCGLPAADKAFS